MKLKISKLYTNHFNQRSNGPRLSTLLSTDNFNLNITMSGEKLKLARMKNSSLEYQSHCITILSDNEMHVSSSTGSGIPPIDVKISEGDIYDYLSLYENIRFISRVGSYWFSPLGSRDLVKKEVETFMDLNKLIAC